MRQFYTKFSLLFFFIVLSHLNTHHALSSDRVVLPTKENVIPTASKKVGPKTLGQPKRLLAHVSKKRKLQVTSDFHTSETPRSFIGNFMPLVSKDIKPLDKKASSQESVGPDPFRFTMTADKETVTVGEELTLTVAVDWMDYGINNGVRFLPEWYKYTLKVVLPKGFIQTGGDYKDFCTKHVDANEPQAVFTIKGKFEYAPEEPKFIILRGFEGANENSEFIWKGDKEVAINNLTVALNNHSKSSKVAERICGDPSTWCIENYSATPNASCTEFILTGNLVNNTSVNAYVNAIVYHTCGTCPATFKNRFHILNTTLSAGSSLPFSITVPISELAENGCPSGDMPVRHFDLILGSNDFTGCGIFLLAPNIKIAQIQTAPSQICSGQTFSITAQGCSSYIWDGFSENSGATLTTSITQNTTFYVRCADSNVSCWPKASKLVNITTSGCCTATKPILNSPTNGCEKVVLKISDASYVASQTYQWQRSTNGTSGWTSVGDGKQSYDATVDGYYRVTASKEGCTNTEGDATSLITIPRQSLPVVTTPITYRVGQAAVPLTATGIAGYSLKWYDNVGTSLANAPTPSTATVGTTNYYVSQTFADGTCESGKAQISVTVTNCEAIVPTLSGLTSACASTTLSYTKQASHTYQWQKKNANGTWDNVPISTTESGGIVSGTITTSGEYKIVATKTDQSCSAEDTKTVSITGIPSTEPSNITGNVSTSCEQSITLSTSGCSTYYWTKDGSELSNIGQNLTLVVPTSGLIKVYCGTSACFNPNYKSVTVNVSTVSTPSLEAKAGTNLWKQSGTNTIVLQTSGCSVGTLKWYKGTTEITPTTGVENGKITASFSNQSDAGKYKVSCGCNKSNEIEIVYNSLCGNQTAPTYKKNGVAVSEISGYSGTSIEIEGTCPNGGTFNWIGANQPVLKTGSIYTVAVPGNYTAQCASSGCLLTNELVARANNCDASVPSFTYSTGTSSVSSGTSVTITGSCSSGNFTWNDGITGNVRSEVITATNRSFGAKCSLSSGCFNGTSADLNVGCNAPTPTFSSSITSFPVKEGLSAWIKGNCDANSTFRWSDGTNGVERNFTTSNDITFSGSCISNTVANCSASNSFSITINKRSSLTLTLAAKNAICTNGTCDGTITATIGNRENNYRFAYWLTKQDASGNWLPQTFTSPSGASLTFVSDGNEKYTFASLPKGKYKVAVKDYSYSGDDSRDAASVIVDIEDVVCPTGGNYHITASKYCLDPSVTNDKVSITVSGCENGVINWWKELSPEGGNWMANIDPTFNPNNVTTPGVYKAVCETDVCPQTRNDKAYSNAVEIIASGKNAPIIVAINDQSHAKAPELEYRSCTSNANGTTRNCEDLPIYYKYNGSGQVVGISDANQLLGNAIAYFSINSNSNVNIPSVSSLDYKLGETITLQAGGCSSGSYKWSNGMSGNYITFTPTENTPIYVWCEDGACKSKYSNFIVPRRTTGTFTISSNGNTFCSESPTATLTSVGCKNTDLTVKWFRKQVSSETPEVEIGTGVNLALTGALTPTFTANYRAECYSGTNLLLSAQPIKITLASELKIDAIMYQDKPLELNYAIFINPCKDQETSLEVKGCVGKVRWGQSVPGDNPNVGFSDDGTPTQTNPRGNVEIIDIADKSGFSSFTKRFTTNDVVYVSCAGVNPQNNNYICSSPWVAINVNVRQKSHAKPASLAYNICENQPLTLLVIDNEEQDKLYSWRYKDAYDNAFEYDFRPKKETGGNYTLNDVVVIPQALALHSGKWQLEAVNDCGSAITEFKINVIRYQTDINFTYTGNYKSMTFKNASTVGFKRYKKQIDDDTVPIINIGSETKDQEEYILEKVDTRAIWTIRKVNSPTDKPVVKTLEQTLLATAIDWEPFTHSFAEPGLYEVTIDIQDPNTSCLVTKTQTIEALCEPPVIPTKPANSDIFACLGATTAATFSATGCTSPGSEIKWYKVDPAVENADTNPIFTGAALSLQLNNNTFTSPGVYKYRAKCHFGVCSSDFSAIYSLTVGTTTTPIASAIDPKTSVASQTLVSAINTRAITLSTTGCEYGSVTWYRQNDNAEQATGNPIAIKFSNVNSVNNTEFGYYAKCTVGSGNNICTSDNSNIVKVKFTECPPMQAIIAGSLTGCGSVTLQVPAGSGDGDYKWYLVGEGFYPKATGEKFEVTLSGTYYYTSCGMNYDNSALISLRKSVVILKSNPAVSGPIVIGTGLSSDPKLTGSDDAPAPPSGYNTLYEWKNLTTATAIVPGSNVTINPFSVTNGGVGVYQLVVKKSTSTDVSATAQCVAPALKTEVYPRGASCAFDFAASNGTVVSCDILAKITITHNNNGTTSLPTGAIVEYRLDLGEWQSSNVIENITYGKHTVSMRMTNGSQICYATRELAESNFDACGKLSCDFEITAKDNLGNETSVIPRDPTTKGLKALTLSVKSFDGSDLTRGVSYSWNSFAKNPQDGGGGPLLLSTQATVTASTVGKYTVDLTRAGVTCSAEIALGSTPCIDTPEPTIKCETKALTGVTDEITNRLRSLVPGDVVRCGDFNVTILEISGGPFEGWSGKGYVKVPYMNAEVSIVFQNAVFNDCYQLTNANATPTQPTVFTEYNSDFFVNKPAGSGGSTSDDEYSAEEEAEQIGEAQKIIDLNTAIADEMKAFNCDSKQKERLNKAIADLEAVRLKAQTNELYTPEQKAQITTSVTNITTLVNSLLSCCVSSSNGRIAADGVCSTTPNAILTKTIDESKALETLPKPAVVPKSTTIYVNGYWNKSYLMKDLLNLSDGEKLKGYWGTDFTDIGGQKTVDNNYFVNGARKMFSSGEERYQEGKKFVEEKLKNKISNFYQKVIQPTQDKNGNYKEPLYFISHSMGAAYAEGMIDALLKAGVKINKVYHFSPADNNDFSVNLPEKTIQIDIMPDPVLLYKNFNDANHINGVIYWGLFNVPSSMSEKTKGHAYTKSRNFVWDWAEIIENLTIITLPGYPSSYKIFTPAPEHYHPQKMCIDGIHYHFVGNSQEAGGSFSSIYSLGF